MDAIDIQGALNLSSIKDNLNLNSIKDSLNLASIKDNLSHSMKDTLSLSLVGMKESSGGVVELCVVCGDRASGQWSVVSGQWSVVSGQWSVVSGQ